MALPTNFQFSQSSLQDFVDCPRRFQLKYIEQLAWPAVEAEPVSDNEIYLRQGAAFHRLVQQYFLGVDKKKLSTLGERDQNLAGWWENFISEVGNLVNLDNDEYFPELSLSSPIEDFRLVGKYDLLMITDAKFTLYDWKTARKQPKREWITEKLQTRVYPFLLVNAGAYLNKGITIDPSQVEMVYWFANFPAAPIKFHYNQNQFNQDQKFITDLIEEIKSLDESPAPLTQNEKRCRFCVYRSLCNRGVAASPLSELDDDDSQELLNFDLDFDQIGEIEF